MTATKAPDRVRASGPGKGHAPETQPLVVAFDIDDTITRCPRFFAFLAQTLKTAGHTVHIVTHRTDRDSTESDLRGWGIPYDRLITWSLDERCDMDQWKASVCRQFGVNVFFEDHVPSLRHVDPGVFTLVPFEAVREPLASVSFDD